MNECMRKERRKVIKKEETVFSLKYPQGLVYCLE